MSSRMPRCPVQLRKVEVTLAERTTWRNSPQQAELRSMGQRSWGELKMKNEQFNDLRNGIWLPSWANLHASGNIIWARFWPPVLHPMPYKNAGIQDAYSEQATKQPQRRKTPTSRHSFFGWGTEKGPQSHEAKRAKAYSRQQVPGP